MLKEGLQKIRKMSVGEIRFRAKQRVRIEWEKLRGRIHSNGLIPEQFLSEGTRNISVIASEFPRRDIEFFGLSEGFQITKNAYQKIFPSGFSKAINDADDLLQHQFHFLGKDFTLPHPVDWSRNPDNGCLYPKQHYSTIRTKDTETYGDIKYVWELNRHQFLIELAKAYFLTGDEKYAAKLRDWIEGWIEANPYKLTVNWTSALESAVRIFSWIWTFYFTSDSGIWSSVEFKRKFLRSLIMEGTYITENLSYYFSPYNHLIGELAALSFLGTIFPELPVSQRWRDKYWKEMEAQIDKQFHRDGFTVEQAAYYHHFTLGFYLLLAVLRQQNNLPVSQTVWDRLEQALEIVMYMTRPDGRSPMIGDIDNARSIYFYYPEDQWNLRAFLALGAVIFDRGDMKYVAGDVSEEVLWLLGREGIEKYQQMSTEEPKSASKAFGDSGYFVMRDGWEDSSNYCCFDCGEIAHGVHKDQTPSAAHGHADILSFELGVDGKPLIIDPGFHTYFGPQDWHRYFRSTEGHNLITVNGSGQAQHEGPISWSKVSSPQPIVWFSSPHLDLVGGAIDRFANLEENVFHRRYVLFRKPFYFLIMDEVIGETGDREKYQVSSFLHFSEGELRFRDFAAYRNHEKVLLTAVPKNTETLIEVGGDHPDQGWMATGYGYKSPAPVLRMDTLTYLPVRYGMLFPTGHVRDKVKRLNMSEYEDDIFRYKIETEDWEEIVYLNPSRRLFETKEYSSARTDALCLISRIESRSMSVVHAIQLKDLSVKSKELSNAQVAGLTVNFKEKGEYTTEEWT